MSTFEALIDGIAPQLVTIAKKLRALVHSVDKETVETVRLGDNAITFGVGERKMLDGCAYVMPLREYVNFGFYQGALLKDPKGLLEGTGKGLRHVKIRSVKDAANPALKTLLKQAIELRRAP